MAFKDCIIRLRDSGEWPAALADGIIRRFDEMVEGGLTPADARQRIIDDYDGQAVAEFIGTFERHLDQGQTPADAKAAVLASVTSRDIRDRVAAKLNATVVLEEPPPGVLRPDQARQFAEAFPTLPTRRERLDRLKEITGDQSLGMGTLQKVQRELAERGLIDPQGGRPAAGPAVPAPEFDIPRLAKKKTKAAGKPQSGVFTARPELAWTGLPGGEFRANLRHIAEKRVMKADPAWLAERGQLPPVGDDLSTPEKVEAHIGEVLAEPTFATVRWREGKPYSMSIVRLGAEGVDQFVGVSLHKSDGTGRLHIATAYNVRREDTIRRLGAALNKNGPEAVKTRKDAPAQLNEVLQLVVQVPKADRGRPVEELTARLSREQAALDAGQRRSALAGWPENQAVARQRFVETLKSGKRAEIPDAIVSAGHDALKPHMSLVPKEVKVGFLKSMTPSAHDTDFVKAVFVLADGTELPIHGSYRKVFLDVRAYADPERKAVLFLRFGGLGRVEGDAGALGDRIAGVGRSNLLGRQSELSGNFRDSVVGELLHELVHMYLRLGLIDTDEFSSLLGHAQTLRLLDTELNSYFRLIRRPENATWDEGETLLDAYKNHYSTSRNPALAIAEEYVAHLAELAWHGGLDARQLDPVRELLEDIFAGDGETMARRLAQHTSAPELGRSRLHALEGPREGPAPGNRLHAVTDTDARAKARAAIEDGKTLYIPPATRTAVTDAIGDMVDVVPEGVRVGVLAKVEPLGDGAARGTYRTLDGQKFTLDGPVEHFLLGGFFDPTEQAIVLNVFNSRGLLPRDDVGRDAVKGLGSKLREGAAPGTRRSLSFQVAIRGTFLHEALHSMWDSLPDGVRARLVSHANDLEVMELYFQDFLEATHWDPRPRTGGDADLISIRDVYTYWFGADAKAVSQEGVTHMLQLATVGALRAEHLDPIRDILDDLFGPGGYTPRAPGAKPAQAKPRPRMASLVDSPRGRLAELRQRLNNLAGTSRSRMPALVDPERAAFAELDARIAALDELERRRAVRIARDQRWRQRQDDMSGASKYRYQLGPAWDEDATMLAEALLSCKS